MSKMFLFTFPCKWYDHVIASLLYVSMAASYNLAKCHWLSISFVFANILNMLHTQINYVRSFSSVIKTLIN
jgi:hypothetical protein